MLSAPLSWGRSVVLAVGLLLAGVGTAIAQSDPSPLRARTALLYGPSTGSGGADTTDKTSRRLQAAFYLGGGFLVSSGAVVGGIEAATILHEGTNRSVGAVLAVGAVGLGVAGFLLIRRGIRLLRQEGPTASFNRNLRRERTRPPTLQTHRRFGVTLGVTKFSCR